MDISRREARTSDDYQFRTQNGERYYLDSAPFYVRESGGFPIAEHTEATLTKAIMVRWYMTIKQPRYVTAVQVNNGAGFGYSRTLDAIVFDTWPSAGLKLHGLEIKVTKADLRRELQNTNKFSEWGPHLDQFSIIAPKGIVDLKLLPPKWGLYIPDGESLRARRKPLMLHAERRTELSRSMAAAFVRALVDRSLSNEAKVAEYTRGHEHGKDEGERHMKGTQRRIGELEEAIAKFEQASGVQISTWGSDQIGEAVKLVVDGGIKRRISYSPNVRTLGEQLLKLADELDSLQEAFA